MDTRQGHLAGPACSLRPSVPLLPDHATCRTVLTKGDTNTMKHLLKSAALAALAPFAAAAGSLETEADPVLVPPAPVVAASPDLIFRLGAGASYGPAYFGSKTSQFGPSGSVSFQVLRLPGGKVLGSETGERALGFAPRGSFRVIGKRSATDHAELMGLADVPLSVEVGFGLGYTAQNFEAFADLRYGVIGHQAWVGELGADVVLRPSDRLTLTAGPRLLLGDADYTNAYFGVTEEESTASRGALAAYGASGGAVSAGLEVAATYALSPLWNLEGALRYDKFLKDAKASPIVGQGRDDDFKLTIGLSRLISLDF